MCLGICMEKYLFMSSGIRYIILGALVLLDSLLYFQNPGLEFRKLSFGFNVQ